MSKVLIGMAVGAALASMSVKMDEVATAETPALAGGGEQKMTPAKPKPEVLTVVMIDGRSVDFVGKRKMLKETLIDGAKVSVRLDFRNGQTRTWAIPDGLLLKAAGHGGEQKLGDETAGEEDVDDMVEAVDDLIARLDKGEWISKSTGGGFGGASVLVKALAEVTGKDVEAVKAFLKAKVDAGATYPKLAAAFEEDDTVGPVIKRMKKEKAAATGVDTKSLLGGLGEVPATAPAASA